MRVKLYSCRHPLLMASVIAPFVLLFGAFQADVHPWLWMLFIGLYAFFGCLCMLISGKWRISVGCIGCAALFASGYCFMPWREGWTLWFIPASLSALLLFTLPMGGWGLGRELNPAWAISGFGVHLVGQLLMHLQQARREVFNALHLPMLISFLAFLALCLLMQNRSSLQSALPDPASVPLSIRRRNRMLVWLLLAFTLLLSLIPVFTQVLRDAWQTIKRLILAFVRWLMSLGWSGSSGGTGGGGGDMELMGMESAQPSLFAEILEKIISVAVAIGVLVLAVLALRILWKQLKKLGRKLVERLRSYVQSASEDYVDELEDTREQGEEAFAFARSLFRKRLTERDLRGLPPREQIRKRYGMLRRKHPEWADSQTVRDTLNAAPAQLYERARYSDHEITAADAEAFRKSKKESPI